MKKPSGMEPRTLELPVLCHWATDTRSRCMTEAFSTTFAVNNNPAAWLHGEELISPCLYQLPARGARGARARHAWRYQASNFLPKIGFGSSVNHTILSIAFVDLLLCSSAELQHRHLTRSGYSAILELHSGYSARAQARSDNFGTLSVHPAWNGVGVFSWGS